MATNLTLEQLRALTPVYGWERIGSGGESSTDRQLADPVQYMQIVADNPSLVDLWAPDGTYMGRDARNMESDEKGFLKFLATAALMAGGAQLAQGAMGAGGGAGIDAGMGIGGAGAEAGLGAGGLGELGYGGMTLGEGFGAGAAGTGGAGLGSGGVGLTGVDMAAGIGGMGMPSYGGMSIATDAAASAFPWQRLLGGAIGAASSRDRTATQTREPWEPAQDWLRELIGQGRSLQQQYAAQPFSQQQQTAYNNLGGLLNTANANAQGLGLLAGANASGANNFDRANPRRQLTGGQALDLSSFAPGLLNFFARQGG